MKAGICRKFRQRQFLLLAGGLLLLMGVYALSGTSMPAWLRSVGVLVGLGGLTVIIRACHRSSGPIPARSIVQDIARYGLRITAASSGIEAFRVSLHAVPVSENAALFFLMGAEFGPVDGELQRSLLGVFSRRPTPQQGVARTLELLEDQYDLKYALVALWQGCDQVLSYLTLDMEVPVVIVRGRSHETNPAVYKEIEHGRRKTIFGARRLSPGERWLLYTKPLVAAATRREQPFSSGGLTRSAYAMREMPNDLWMDYLLEQAITAHKGSLPEGSVLASVVCEESAAATFDSSPQSPLRMRT